MKILFAPYGTLGDVAPALALAVGLQNQGHEVLVSAPPEYESLVNSRGCRFHPLGSNLKEATRSLPEPAMHILRATSWLFRFLAEQLPLQLKQLLEIAPGFDLVVGASLNFAAPTVAEACKKPYRFLAYSPQLIPSPDHPPVMLPIHGLPRSVNRLAWRLNSLAWNVGLKKKIDAERKTLNLPPAGDFVSYWIGENPILASDSPLGSAPDASIRHTQTGYLHLQSNDPLSKELEAFLDAGPAPIYVGFGNMINESCDQITAMVMEAARVTGNRLILSRGWANFGATTGNANCHVAGSEPHSLLFPRVSGIIHHGGSGTTAAAARAGVPQILVPHITDQYYWAYRIRRLGLGPRCIWRKYLTTSRLITAIRELDLYRVRAKEMARVLAEQNPLEETIRAMVTERLP